MLVLIIENRLALNFGFRDWAAAGGLDKAEPSSARARNVMGSRMAGFLNGAGIIGRSDIRIRRPVVLESRYH